MSRSGAEILCPCSSVSSHRKAVCHSYLPGFHRNSVFTQPVTSHFYIRHMTLFCASKLYRSLQSTPALLLPGKGDWPPWSCCWLGPCSDTITQLCPGGWFMTTLLGLLSAMGFPVQYLGTLFHSGTPILSVSLRS